MNQQHTLTNIMGNYYFEKKQKIKRLPPPLSQYTTTCKSPGHHPDEPGCRHYIHLTRKQDARDPKKK